MTEHLHDPSDYCRQCGGQKGFREYLGEGRWCWEDCWQCGGTGWRTVLVLPAATQQSIIREGRE